MQVSSIIDQLPYPIASVYANLEDAQASAQTRREAIYFTGYQLMRTVGLTLVGQYLTQEIPPDAEHDAQRALNRAIAGVRCPYYSDWITLLSTLHKHGAKLKLDFFPEFAGAMAAVKRSRVDVPRTYGLEYGKQWQGLSWLMALLALRNSVAHSGMGGQEVCVEAVQVFRPLLDELLEAFAFLSQYQMLVLRTTLDDEPRLVQVMRGAEPAAPVEMALDARLLRAFESSLVVLRAPDGRVQSLFPFFHGHLEGEPLSCYDGHYLLGDPKQSVKMTRRMIYYLGNAHRLPLEDADAPSVVRPPAPFDAAEQLKTMLEGRQIAWHIKREDVALWTLRDTVNDYARRTLDELRGVKYLPACYLDRPALSAPLWQMATADAPPYRALLLTGRAGSGKTALLSDLVRHLLEDEAERDGEHLVFFIRGDGLTPELAGGNLLLANLLHKIGLNPKDFPTCAEFFAYLAAKGAQDLVVNRRFVLVIDALNEARPAAQFLREALELVAAARQHEWLRIVLSAREEFLAIWRGRRDGLETNPFYAVQAFFVPPPDDPARPRRPEDPPAWDVPPFTPGEAAEVYRRYQQAKADGVETVPACRTAWEQIPPATRATLLSQPLHLDLWMRAFDDRAAPAVSGLIDLFNFYLDDLRRRFDQFWESMSAVLDRMLERGRMELTDDDAHEIEGEWRRHVGEAAARLSYTPLEVACVAGVMQKRTTEEGGGYRIPHQRLREALLYLRLIDRDPRLSAASLRAWLAVPPTEELEGALALIAGDLWRQERSADLAVFMAEPEWPANISTDERGGGVPIGVPALERMLARRLESQEEPATMATRLQTLLDAVPDDADAKHRMSSLLLFDVKERVKGLPVTQGLCAIWEICLVWLEAQQRRHPEDEFYLHDVFVSYNQLGDMYLTVGESHRASRFYEKGLEIAELRYKAEPHRFDLALNMFVSYGNLGNMYHAAGESQRALQFYQQSLEIAERLYKAEPHRAEYASAVSVFYTKLGDLYQEAGQSQRALQFYENSFAVRERIYEAQPESPDLAYDLSVGYMKLGEVYQAQGENQRATQFYLNSLEIKERLCKAEPHRSDFANSVSNSYERIADVYQQAGESQRAVQFYLKSLEIRERLYEAEPQRSDVAFNLSVSYVKLGEINQLLGQSQRASQYYEKGAELTERLYTAEPQRSDFARAASYSYDGLGDVCREAGESQPAVQFYLKSLEIRERLYKAEPHRADFARDVFWSCDRLARATGGFGTTEGRGWFERVRRILRTLKDENRMPDVGTQNYLNELEEKLG